MITARVYTQLDERAYGRESAGGPFRSVGMLSRWTDRYFGVTDSGRRLFSPNQVKASGGLRRSGRGLDATLSTGDLVCDCLKC